MGSQQKESGMRGGVLFLRDRVFNSYQSVYNNTAAIKKKIKNAHGREKDLRWQVYRVRSTTRSRRCSATGPLAAATP